MTDETTYASFHDDIQSEKLLYRGGVDATPTKYFLTDAKTKVFRYTEPSRRTNIFAQPWDRKRAEAVLVLGRRHL